MKKRRGLIKKFAFCMAVMSVSPFVCAFAVKYAPSLSALAADVAGFSLGAEKDSGYNITISDDGMLSYGSPSEDDNSFSEEPPESTASPEEFSAVGPLPYPYEAVNNSGSIIELAFGKQSGTQFFSLTGGAQAKNITELPNSELIAESRLPPEFSLRLDGSPEVLIMHTHTTESYEPYDRDFYDAEFISRTTDENMNMVSVGEKIAVQLEAEGIGVIHDKTIHDYPSYNGSYDRSAVTVRSILEQYPTIKVVLDIHRDAIEYEDGTRVAPTVEIDGKKAAQIMIISGCDNGTMNYPEYMKNFRFACLLQRQVEDDYKGLARPILFTYKKYNQNLTTGSILIEVGSHANSVDEAQYSGELVGKSLAEALKTLREN